MYRLGGPAERAGRPEGCSHCCGDVGIVTTGQLKVTQRRRCRRGGRAATGAGGSPVFVSVVAAGGRPRFGGCATCTSGGDLHGLSLSVEMCPHGR